MGVEGIGVGWEAEGAVPDGVWSPHTCGGRRANTEVADDGLAGAGVGDRQNQVDGGGRWTVTGPSSADVVGKERDAPSSDNEGDGDPAVAAAAGLLCPEGWECPYREEGDLIL